MKSSVDIINHHHKIIKSIIEEYTHILKESLKTNDQIASAVQIYENMRRLNDVVKSYKDNLKDVITDDMLATGVVKQDAGPYVVSLRKGATRASVKDIDILKKEVPDVFKPQPDKVDIAELGKILKFKELKGAVLEEGAPTIMVKGRE